MIANPNASTKIAKASNLPYDRNNVAAAARNEAAQRITELQARKMRKKGIFACRDIQTAQRVERFV
ncbi:MAG: hypothetical protein WA633_13800 [Stellaceae bacterium]